jgi:DNA modification methylase
MNPYYEHGGIKIYHAHCEDLIEEVKHVDAVVADPPYGINGGSGGNRRVRPHSNYVIPNAAWVDDEKYIREVVVPYFGIFVDAGKRMAITPGNRCLFLYPRPKDVGCFWSPGDSGFGSWGMISFHPILYYGRDPRSGIAQSSTGRLFSGKNNRAINHPCPKPLKEWQWLVNKCTQPGDTVLDPFMGSGTTLVAAKNLGLKAIGIEVEEQYCELAATRLGQEVLTF